MYFCGIKQEIKKMMKKKTMLFIVCTLAVALLLSGLFFLSHFGANKDSAFVENALQEEKGIDEANVPCTCPFVRVSLQPLGDFTQKEAERLQKDLEKNLSGTLDIDMLFEMLPTKPLEDTWKNDAKSRYRADKIINSMARSANKQHIIIALTHKDVSVSYKGNKDWGVLGLNLIPKKLCVVSTYRLKDKRDLWKVATHEFIHTCFEYQHCPKDNPTCIMKDAKGHAHFANKESLCDVCKKAIFEKY